MRWIIVDVVLALLALALLAVVALGLWRRVKALGRTVAAATAQLEVAFAGRHPPDTWSGAGSNLPA